MKFNPSGRPWKGTAKRPPPSGVDCAVNAVRITPSVGQPSLAELQVKALFFQMSLTPSVTLIASEGALFILGLADDVISDVKPLCVLRGKYLTDPAAVASMKDPLSKSVAFKLKGDSLITASVTTKKTHSIPKQPMPLSALLEALSSHGLANFKLHKHSIALLDSGDWEVNSDGNVTLEIPALGEKATDDLVPPTKDNFGNFLNLAALKTSPHVHIVLNLIVDETKSGAKIHGGMANVHLKVPIECKKDELIQLTWKD